MRFGHTCSRFNASGSFYSHFEDHEAACPDIFVVIHFQANKNPGRQIRPGSFQMRFGHTVLAGFIFLCHQRSHGAAFLRCSGCKPALPSQNQEVIVPSLSIRRFLAGYVQSQRPSGYPQPQLQGHLSSPWEKMP